jgi:hypothetical protein
MPAARDVPHACDLRVQYVEGYEAGRAATLAQWADHMKRMNAALRANLKPPNDPFKPGRSASA